jgi:NAD-dependent oxidoreductase involved in siderophore biosynthesis
MPSFNAEGLTYPQAIALIKSLNSQGIDANISIGCVSVQPSESQWGQARAIAKQSGASLTMGLSLLQEMTLPPQDVLEMNRTIIEGDLHE